MHCYLMSLSTFQCLSFDCIRIFKEIVYELFPIKWVVLIGNISMNPFSSDSQGLGNSEICPPKNQSTPTGPNAPGNKLSMVLYGDSEELNCVVVLTLARSIHVNGLEQQSAQWVKELLTNIMQKTPHSWPSHTLQNFPPILQEFFKVSLYSSCLA